MSAKVHELFADSPCMNLRSFRKDGTPVDTPLWVVTLDGKLGSYTDDRSYKYKRVRRNPRVEVAACDVWGRRSTPWHAAVCRIVEQPEQRQRIFDLIKRKYHIHWYMSLWGSLLVGRVKHRVVFEIEPEDEPIAVP